MVRGAAESRDVRNPTSWRDLREPHLTRLLQRCG
jgi:hypothetical protein